MLDDPAVLALWERTLGQPPWRRDDALLGAAGESAPASLAARNAGLLRRHRDWFGTRLVLCSACPHCGEVVEFEADSEALGEGLEDTAGPGVQTLDWQDHRIEFVLPDRDDVAWAAQQPQAFEARLLQRCLRSARFEGQPCVAESLPEPVFAALMQRMEALAPGASLSFALACPACGLPWVAPLDVGALVGQAVRERAEQVLLEVDALARSYGWTEPEVLALPPARRAAYLQMAGGA